MKYVIKISLMTVYDGVTLNNHAVILNNVVQRTQYIPPSHHDIVVATIKVIPVIIWISRKMRGGLKFDRFSLRGIFFLR